MRRVFALSDRYSHHSAEDFGEPRTNLQAIINAHHKMLRRFALTLTAGDERRAERVIDETFFRVGLDLRRIIRRAATLRPRLVLLARQVACEAGHDDRPRYLHHYYL